MGDGAGSQGVRPTPLERAADHPLGRVPLVFGHRM